MAEREEVDLTPGDYWLTSCGDGRGRAIVTLQRELLIEQYGGGWSCLGIGAFPEWGLEPRTFVPDDPDPWHAADLQVKEWRDAAEEAAEREREISDLARDLAGEFHHHDGHLVQARDLYELGWRRAVDE